MKVNCSKCGESHKPGQVETLNIEEDFQGFDVLTYICPVTNQKTQAYVLGSIEDNHESINIAFED